jgi:RND family efflux transporter MFP subunit
MEDHMMNRHAILSLLLLLLLPALASAQTAAPAPVTVEPARRDTFAASLWVPGTVISSNDARVAAETDGRITWVAEVGSRIAAGEAFARIDDADLRLSLQDDRARLESLRAQQRYQQANLERLERLALSNNAAANQIDEAQSQFEMTLQEIQRAGVAVAQTQRRIEQAQVLAPFPAVVVERLVQVGEFVSRGTPVARLVDTDNREIRVQAPLSVAPFIREGLEVSIQHGGNETLSPVARVIPVGDERSRMFEIRIAAEHPAWVVGSPVRVALPHSDPRELVAIPRDALVLRGSEIFVLRVTPENTVEKIKVDTGIGLGSLIEVIGQLDAGDRVVVRGAERLQSGQAVVVTNPESQVL